jgi:hypothetical protein
MYEVDSKIARVTLRMLVMAAPCIFFACSIVCYYVWCTSTSSPADNTIANHRFDDKILNYFFDKIVQRQILVAQMFCYNES